MMKTKSDLEQWRQIMLPTNFEYLNQSGAAYLPSIRSLEALLRPLWGVLPAYFTAKHPSHADQFYIAQLQKRVESNDLPTISTANRQIVVELGPLAYALSTYSTRFLALFSKTGQQNLITWLNRINTIDLPAGNWYFFLVLVNGALKQNHLSYSQTKLSWALNQIETFYLGHGWYTDGPGQQRDYYIAFAFNFYGLLYTRMANDATAKRFKQRALLFADDFQYWFDQQGRSLPFGRSLTYRFAHVAFWSALVVTKAYQSSHFSLEQLKGLIMRNFEFWQQQPITLPNEHNLSIGYGYQQALMAEDYNAPGSPMWAFKPFILFELPTDDAFWQVKSAPLSKSKLVTQPAPGFQIASDIDQTTALSARQFPKNPALYQGAEKYSKFAYSSYFGFNVSHGGPGLAQKAIDSTLAISLPGHDMYTSRQTIDQTILTDRYSISQWQLWQQIHVTTTLIPISAACHLRLQRIETPVTIDTAEGGFPLPVWNRKYNQSTVAPSSVSLTNQHGLVLIQDLLNNRRAKVVPQGPNTNLYSSEKNSVPTLVQQITPGTHYFACLVYGSPKSSLPTLPAVNLNIKNDTYQIQIEDNNLIIPVL